MMEYIASHHEFFCVVRDGGSGCVDVVFIERE
jgi:hypothetical protein